MSDICGRHSGTVCPGDAWSAPRRTGVFRLGHNHLSGRSNELECCDMVTWRGMAFGLVMCLGDVPGRLILNCTDAGDDVSHQQRYLVLELLPASPILSFCNTCTHVRNVRACRQSSVTSDVKCHNLRFRPGVAACLHVCASRACLPRCGLPYMPVQRHISLNALLSKHRKRSIRK